MLRREERLEERGTVDRAIIEPGECKGCGLCVESCPRDCITIGTEINSLGYQYAHFDSEECDACGLCFYVCPEPGAITVVRDRGQNEAATVGKTTEREAR